MFVLGVFESGVGGSFIVETKTGLVVGLIGAVAEEALVREDGADVGVVADFLSGSGEDEGDEDEDGSRAEHGVKMDRTDCQCVYLTTQFGKNCGVLSGTNAATKYV